MLASIAQGIVGPVYAKTLSPVTFAVALGVACSFLVPDKAKPGLKFCMTWILQIGVVLIGLKLSLFEITRVGFAGVPIIVCCMLTALAATYILGRWLRVSEILSTLVAIGTSICGISAVLAAGPALKAKEEEMSYAVAVISVFGFLAFFIHPWIANAFFSASPWHAGLFLGTAIHDTAQVVSASYIYSELYHAPEAATIATVTKLLRNSGMIVVIPALLLFFRWRTASDTKMPSVAKLVPKYILWFLVVSGARSAVDGLGDGNAEWFTQLLTFADNVSKNCLLLATAAIGLSSPWQAFVRAGTKPLLLGMTAAILVGGVSVALLHL
jgi:uncharacterized integral membrane protein (TIGR00698 family)